MTSSPWSPAGLGDLTGKRVIVAGATNGVGLGTTRARAHGGTHTDPLRGGPVPIGRSAPACDHDTATRLVAFAERETSTRLVV